MSGAFHFESPMRSEINRDNAKMARAENRVTTSVIDILDGDVERLFMLTEALWGFMKKEHGYTDEQLLDMITDIDLSDGKLDGRKTTEAVQCPNCGRSVSKARPVCIYCGKEVPIEPSPFDR